MQMGFAARNAVTACDLAAVGFDGPKDVLEGAFGYFNLFEPGGSSALVVQDLGRRWFITELAHKPFPCGRATHGIIEACLELRRRHQLAAEQIHSAKARVPPLVHHLVGRPARQEMATNYARLCAAYVAASALRNGNVGLGNFGAEACRDALTQDLARRIVIEEVDVGDALLTWRLPAEQIHELGHVAHVLEPIDARDQPVGPIARHRPESRYAIVVELRKMIGPAERLGRIAADAVEPQCVPRAVAQIDLDLDRRQGIDHWRRN